MKNKANRAISNAIRLPMIITFSSFNGSNSRLGQDFKKPNKLRPSERRRLRRRESVDKTCSGGNNRLHACRAGGAVNFLTSDGRPVEGTAALKPTSFRKNYCDPRHDLEGKIRWSQRWEMGQSGLA